MELTKEEIEAKDTFIEVRGLQTFIQYNVGGFFSHPSAHCDYKILAVEKLSDEAIVVKIMKC